MRVGAVCRFKGRENVGLIVRIIVGNFVSVFVGSPVGSTVRF